MSNERGPLREISWRDVCPWLILFRGFRISISVHVLLLAALAATACTCGWMLSELLFVRQETLDKDPSFGNLVRDNNQWPWDIGRQVAGFGHGIDPDGGVLSRFGTRAAAIPRLFINRFVDPFRFVFRRDATLVKSAYCLFGGIWCLAAWAFFGGAITRIAVMRLGCEERVGLREALRHACRKFGAYFTAPLMPLIAVLLLALPLIVLGLVMRSDVGVVIAGFLWLLVIIDALIMGVMLMGLVFGWPLMWGTVSAEGSDSFDALSRSYNFTFQRPLHYLFYAVVASLFGVFCFLLVGMFSNLIVNLALWGVSWGTTNVRMHDLFASVGTSPNASAETVSGTGQFGVEVISFFMNFVYLVAGAFAYGFFWSLSSAIYLLLRYDVDQTEFDEIWLEESEDKYELPQLNPSESGVPQLSSAEDAEPAVAEGPEPGGESADGLEKTTPADDASRQEDVPPGNADVTSSEENASRPAEAGGPDEEPKT